MIGIMRITVLEKGVTLETRLLDLLLLFFLRRVFQRLLKGLFERDLSLASRKKDQPVQAHRQQLRRLCVRGTGAISTLSVLFDCH